MAIGLSFPIVTEYSDLMFDSLSFDAIARPLL